MKQIKKVKHDQLSDQPTDWPTDAQSGMWSRVARNQKWFPDNVTSSPVLTAFHLNKQTLNEQTNI